VTRLQGQVAVVTGGSGVLGRQFCAALAREGAHVALMGRSQGSAENAARTLEAQGARVLPVCADVLDRESLARAHQEVRAQLGPVTVLVNGAGGNRPEASTSAERAFFDLPAEALRSVMDLNFLGTVLSTQVFARDMVEAGSGSVVNVTSMAAARPMTRVVGYAAAKAAVENLTRWLAVHLASEHGPNIRVNALAPGFFRTEQNRYLLQDEAGAPTERARLILAHTPQGRFGQAEDLDGALVWLASPDSRFVTGSIVAVDGGFGAYSGV